jgi:hypothetical protein
MTVRSDCLVCVCVCVFLVHQRHEAGLCICSDTCNALAQLSYDIYKFS